MGEVVGVVLVAPSPSASMVFSLVDDPVSVLSLENNNLVGIKVVNRPMAQNFDAMFDALWGAATAPR